MNAQLPVHLQNRQRRNLTQEAVGGISIGTGPHISITANRFTLVDAAGNEKPIQTLYLDVCVVDANRHPSKIFYDPRVPYDPNNSSPPLCFSDNGVGASARAQQPQNTSCAVCQWNAWGSAVSRLTGAQTKACNDVKKIAVVVPGETLPFMLRIPPASLKNWAAYCTTVASHNVDLPDILTRLEFESQGVLKFSPVGYVDEATAMLGDRVLEAKATDQMLGKTDVAWNGQGAPQLAPPAQAPAQQLMPPPAQAPAAAPPFMAPQAPAPQFMPPPQAAPAAPQAPQQGFAPAPSAPAAPAPQRAPRKPRGQRAAEPAPQAPPFMPAPQQAQAAPAAAPFGAPTAAPASMPAPTTAPAAAPSGQMPDLPPFLQRNPAATPAQPPPLPPQAGFGMQAAPAPDAGMQAALDQAFNLPIPGAPPQS